MEFLDFLKYGAIGISLALAVLSYRLLSKEQDKTEVRKPILNTMKYTLIENSDITHIVRKYLDIHDDE